MNTQIALIDLQITKRICETCKYFSDQDEFFYCKFFEALLAEETLCLPCDFKECDSTTENLLK